MSKTSSLMCTPAGPYLGLSGPGLTSSRLAWLEADEVLLLVDVHEPALHFVGPLHERVPCLPFRETSEMRLEIETRCRAMYPFALFDLGFVGDIHALIVPCHKFNLGRDKSASGERGVSCRGTARLLDLNPHPFHS